ncbi:hypothetical protein BST81_13370 [Leptolyngbya sp. 'hensonii']|nr:hypothetical protein BST81_13370 [Leptolyngbya sp. 'hensonii']
MSAAAPEQEGGETGPSRPKPRRFLLPAILLTILLLLGGGAWLIFSRLLAPLASLGQGGPPPLPVKTAPVTTATIEDSSEYVASLQSRQSVTLRPRVAGQVQEILVRAGDPVTAGQTVLQIDPAEQEAVVSNRQFAVETSLAEIESARADAANARDALQSLEAIRQARQADVRLNQQEYDRFQRLYREGAASRQLLDQKLNSLQTAQAELLEAEADIRAQRAIIARQESNITRSQRAFNEAQSNVTQQEVQLQYYTIAAPFNGTVGDIPIKVGDYVSSTTSLLSITQNKELEIQVGIPIEKAPRLRKGLPVQLISQAGGRPLKTGRIFFIAPDVDPQSQSVLVKAVFDNADGKLRTQQFIGARIIWARQANGVLVPVTAIARQAGKDFVFVPERYDARCKATDEQQGKPKGRLPKDDQLVVRQQIIRSGKIIGNNQEVLEGLKPSDRIAVDNLLQLQDCAPISEQGSTNAEKSEGKS